VLLPVLLLPVLLLPVLLLPVLLLPVLLSAGGLLHWATRCGSKIGLVVSTLLVALPFFMLTHGKITQMSENARAREQQAGHGQFVDAHLNSVVAAIDAGDTSALQQLLAAKSPPRSRRVRWMRVQTAINRTGTTGTRSS